MHSLRTLMFRAVLMLAAGLAMSQTQGELELFFDNTARDALPAAMMKNASDAYAANLRGIELLDSGRIDDAMVFFEKALAALPGYSDAENNRGVVYFRKGQVGQARQIWQRLLDADPRYSVVYYNMGILAYHESDFKSAHSWFEQALKINRRFVEAIIMQATLAERSGNTRDAVVRMRKAMEIDPANSEAWGGYAQALLANRDTVAALEVLNAHQNNALALTQIAIIHGAQRRFDSAAATYSRAVAAGAPAQLLVHKAAMHLDMGECANATGALQSYFKRVTQASADAWILAGVASRECNDLKAARRFFEQGLEQYPGDPILKYNMAQMYFHAGQYRQAQQIWEGLADTIADPQLFYQRAMAARFEKNPDMAESFVRKAIALDRKAEFYDLLGVILHERGRREDALAAFKQALAIDARLQSAQLNLALLSGTPEDLAVPIEAMRADLDSCRQECGPVALRLSILHYRAGQADRALSVLEALPTAQRTENVVRHLAIYYREKQHWDKAIEVLLDASRKLVLEPRTEYELAECYLAKGQHRAAIDVLKRLIPRWHENPWRLMYQIGYAAMENNDLATSQAYLRRSLKEKADNVAARGLLAFVLNLQGQGDEARILWERNLRDDPDNPVLWINMGLAREGQGLYQQALDSYHKALLLAPQNLELHLNIGNVYLAMHRYRDAAHNYERALGSARRAVAAYNLVLAAMRSGERERVNAMRQLLEREFPGQPYTIRAQAEYALLEGDTLRARVLLEGLLEKNDNDWAALASIYCTLEQLAKAQDAIARIPASASWRQTRLHLEATVAFRQKRFDDAFQLWKSSGDSSFATQYNMASSLYHGSKYHEMMRIATRIAPQAHGRDRINLCRMIGNAAFNLKDYRTARGWYLQLTGLDASDAVALYNLAVACYNLDEVDNAWKYYQQARSLDNTLYNGDIERRFVAVSQPAPAAAAEGALYDSIEVLYNQAVDQQDSGNDSTALLLYSRIVQIDSNFVQAWNNQGAIYGARGELEKARLCYQKSIERRHDLPEAYVNLIRLYLAQDDLTQARYWLVKGTLHNPGNPLIQQADSLYKETARVKATETTP